MRPLSHEEHARRLATVYKKTGVSTPAKLSGPAGTACIASGSTAGQCAPRALVLPLTSCPDLAQAWRSLPPIALLDEMLSASELPSLYAAADAFVLPSRGEGWDRPVTG